MQTSISMALIAAAAAAVAAAPAAEDLAARAARVHRDAIVVDTHQDVPEALEEKWADGTGTTSASPAPTKHVDIPRLQQGGVTAPFFVVYVRVATPRTAAPRAALELSDMVDAMVARIPRSSCPRPRSPTSAGPRGAAASPSSWASRAATRSRTPSACCASSTGWACAT